MIFDNYTMHIHNNITITIAVQLFLTMVISKQNVNFLLSCTHNYKINSKNYNYSGTSLSTPQIKDVIHTSLVDKYIKLAYLCVFVR